MVASGRLYVTAVHDYGVMVYGWVMEDTMSFCKLLVDLTTGWLIGVYIMGEEVLTLIQFLV